MSKSKIENQREFGLSSWAVKNRKTVYLLIMMILLGGFASYQSMPKENFPELQIPEIYIGIAYPGNSPELIAEKITDPIEKELKTIKNVDEINSTSIDGYASINIKFDFTVSPKQGLQDVKDAVDKARATKDFPADLPVEPNIFEMDVSEMPIMNINLSGDYSISDLKDYAEILEDKIEALVEISEVDIRGIQDQEMQIMVDPKKAEMVDVSFNDIQTAISNENITMSGGEYLDGTTKRTIQIDGKFKSAKEIENVIVKQEDYKPVYLRDIAEVKFTDADTTSYARERGNTVVMLDVKKRSGQNLLEASRKINEIIAQVEKDKILPAGINLSVTNDQSGKTEEMVSNLLNSIIFGVLLVVGVLLFFLGLRNAIFVGVAIPLSMLMSFLILSTMGVTLNTMVLFSLVLALGMLVDNGIVVVENIQRLMEEGVDSFTAAKKGVGEVAWPIIASTATTLGAFIPLAFWPGIMGEFMKYLPITLIIVLGSSLFVALIVNPVLTAMWMKVDESNKKKKIPLIVAGIFIVLGFILLGVSTGAGNLFIVIGLFVILNIFVLTPATKTFQEKFLPRLESGYEKILAYALKRRRPVYFFLGTIGLLFMSLVFVGIFTPKVLFFPENQPNYVNIFIQHPIGTDIRVTNETTLEVERIINEEILPEELGDTVNKDFESWIIQSVIAQVGNGTSDPSQGIVMGNTPHKGRVTINFSEFKYRKDYETGHLMEKISNGLKNKFPADIQITVDKDNQGPPTAPPINIEVGGEIDYNEVIAEAEKIRIFLDRKNVHGVEKLKLDVETGKPELRIEIDREKARLFNTSTGQIANAVRTALFGADISTFKEGDDTYDMVVRFNDKSRNDLDALMNQKLIFRNNKGQMLRIPIRALISTPKPTTTYSSVIHKDQIPIVTIFSNVQEGYNANEIVAELKEIMEQYEDEVNMTDGVEVKFTGEQEEQADQMAFLSKALLIAVFIILLVIVAQFNSYTTPVIILFSVVFSLIGVFMGEVIFQMEFVIMMTMIGIISLAGVVVNNAIVLIDYTDLLRRRRREELGLSEYEQLPLPEIVDFVVQAGKTRLRPVLLTALTTILGLIPLAMGLNIDFTTLFTEYSANYYRGGDNTMFFGPMSWTIIFGLTFATFLTLIIVPVMYLILYRFKVWLHKITNAKMRSSI
ncbi:efflux RND transporter permease subunit [Crocinitomix catalasitica]|uniref:efflux RND transporter permease subunit n=1 Tax=Crocinitomix catalasitica TaxID=184607 RepID=UPI00048800A2|nr:efflux RND transporter permease subunit [Crocinitomix catalasitica]